jgi:hypothetical protein
MVDRRSQPPHVFELSGTRQGELPPDMFGLWVAAPAPEAAGISFDTAAPDQPDELIWRVNLPPDLAVAQSYLVAGAERLEWSWRALDGLEERMGELGPAGAQATADAGSVTFSTGDPDDQLMAQLQAMLGQLPGAEAQQATGPGARPAAILDMLTQMVTNYAAVETRVGEQVLARTSVGWTGDTDTFLQTRIGSQQIQIHQRALGIALRSRALLIRTVLFAIQLSTAIGTGNPIAALPITWRYINRAVAIVRG